MKKFIAKQTCNIGVFESSDEAHEIIAILNTDGSGLWSKENRKVLCIGINVDFHGTKWGEMRVYFDTKTWNIKKHGLIYTDKQFLKELKAYLKFMGIDGSSITYSEQGMQGDNYVSLDVEKSILKSWKKVFCEQ